MTGQTPESLSDLLKTLEHSSELRSLARQCGLSVRELRRRLSIWRRELAVEESLGAATDIYPSREAIAADEPVPSDFTEAQFPELPTAADMVGSPVPGFGAPVLEVYAAGASRGNPGPAAIGVIFGIKGGALVAEHSSAIGSTTNNVAEYRALVAALNICQRWGAERVHLRLDSELIVRQLHGVYRVKSPDLRPLYQQVVFLGKGFCEFQVAHVTPVDNVHAAALVKRILVD